MVDDAHPEQRRNSASHCDVEPRHSPLECVVYLVKPVESLWHICELPESFVHDIGRSVLTFRDELANPGFRFVEIGRVEPLVDGVIDDESCAPLIVAINSEA